MSILTPEKIGKLEEVSLEVSNKFRQSWQKVLDIPEALEIKELVGTLEEYSFENFMYLRDVASQIQHSDSQIEISREDSFDENTSEYIDYLKVKNPIILIIEEILGTSWEYQDSLRPDKATKEHLDMTEKSFPDLLKDKERTYESMINSRREVYDRFTDNGFVGEVNSSLRFFWDNFFRHTEAFKVMDVLEIANAMRSFDDTWWSMRRELIQKINVEES